MARVTLKELTLSYSKTDDTATVKKKLMDAISIIGTGGDIVEVTVVYIQKPVKRDVPKPKVVRTRQPKAPASAPFTNVLPGTEGGA
jgi:hypothetical protein